MGTSRSGGQPAPARRDVVDFSKETLEMFKELLEQSTISAGHPEFDTITTKISQAKRELNAALALKK